MTAYEKIYHIYAKNRCLFHSLREEEFFNTWDTLKKLVNVLDTGYQESDLTYEELTINKRVVLDSSH
ncbi:hypothetical protein EB169_02560 [archaeon]|jgi:hypothetical protein|nr:hypothetical protein [archaeon]